MEMYFFSSKKRVEIGDYWTTKKLRRDQLQKEVTSEIPTDFLGICTKNGPGFGVNRQCYVACLITGNQKLLYVIYSENNCRICIWYRNIDKKILILPLPNFFSEKCLRDKYLGHNFLILLVPLIIMIFSFRQQDERHVT